MSILTRLGLILGAGVCLGGLVGCEANLTTAGGEGRPSIIAACAERPRTTTLASAPKRHRDEGPPIVVNLPAPEPTIRCDRGGSTTPP